MQTEAAILREQKGDFSIEEVEIGELNPDEMIVEMVGTGVCHTDELFREGTYPFEMPCILGHEGAGYVRKVGSQVKGLEPGDAVVLSVMYCGTCPRCLQGQHYLCHNIYEANFCGRGDGTNAITQHGCDVHAHFDGQSSFSRHAVTNVKNTYKVRDDAPLHMLGPLGCGFRTGLGAVLNTFKPSLSQSIAIYGAGAVGLSAMLAAVAIGCHPIVMVDINPDRRGLALELGATQVLDGKMENVSAAVMEITGGGADFVLDTTGIPPVIRNAMESTGVGGFLGVLGGSPLGTELVLDANHLLFGGRRIQGINMGDSVAATFIPQMVDMFMEGKLPLDRLITEYNFTEINQAFEDTVAGKTIKAVLRF